MPSLCLPQDIAKQDPKLLHDTNLRCIRTLTSLGITTKQDPELL
jgi:hypothetical protein